MDKRVGPLNHKWNGGKTTSPEGYILIRRPDHPRANHRGYVREHVLIAERAMGKPLPLNAVIHHVNGTGGDNNRGNHVVCQDQAYHNLLEQRTRAYLSCGKASWRKCCFCKKYDDPQNMYIPSKVHQGAFHRKCKNEYQHKLKNRSIRTPDTSTAAR